MDVRALLLRHIPCSHPTKSLSPVSELVIYRDATSSIPCMEIARQIVVCSVCGLPVEVRDVERAV